MRRARGLDLSAYQTILEPKTWLAAAQAAGYSFCFLKTSEGNKTKSKVYQARYKAGRDLGLHMGAYHFAHPDATARDPQREAALMFEISGPWQPRDVPPVLDLEETDPNLTPGALTQWARAFLQEIERLSGRHPLLYTGPNFWMTKLARSPALAEWPLWIAQYPCESKPQEPIDSKGPTKLAPWPTWLFWQWTGKGRLLFHTGDLDLNLFNGTEAELSAWCGA
jgi:GH25 family lysozyme M1 (1,4-beta-N-acetylmuramidase)